MNKSDGKPQEDPCFKYFILLHFRPSDTQEATGKLRLQDHEPDGLNILWLVLLKK